MGYLLETASLLLGLVPPGSLGSLTIHACRTHRDLTLGESLRYDPTLGHLLQLGKSNVVELMVNPQ